VQKQMLIIPNALRQTTNPESNRAIQGMGILRFPYLPQPHKAAYESVLEDNFSYTDFLCDSGI